MGTEAIIELLCSQHMKTVSEAFLTVCRGRKVVYVLNHGKIDRPHCVVVGRPTRSYGFSSIDKSYGCYIIPNGWKVATVMNEMVYVGEVLYPDDGTSRRLYQFTIVDAEGNPTFTSGWHITPSGAFRLLENKRNKKEPLTRSNGKLYIGCAYESTQYYIREHFLSYLEEGIYEERPDLKKIIIEWLSEYSDSSSIQCLQPKRKRRKNHTSE